MPLNKYTATLASKGRGGDSEIGHLTPGEIVLPANLPQQQPDLYAQIEAFFGDDLGRYTVGGNDDSINPATGYPEFEAPGNPGAAGGGTGAPGSSSGGGGGGNSPQSQAQGLASLPPTAFSGPGHGDATGEGVSSGVGPTGKSLFNVNLENEVISEQQKNPKAMETNLSLALHNMSQGLAETGTPPGAISQQNQQIQFMPSIFGENLGLVDPVTGETISPAQIASMTPAQFSALSSNPDTGVVGDPESPFGQVMSQLGLISSIAMNPTLAGLAQTIASEVIMGNERLSLPGLFGDDGSLSGLNPFSGLINSLSHELSNANADSISTFGPSTAVNGGGQPSNMGPGIVIPQQPAFEDPNEALQRFINRFLTPEQRTEQSTELFNILSGGANLDKNPFSGEDALQQFQNVIQGGIDRGNTNLGIDDITQGQFATEFGSPNIIDNILNDETGIRKQRFTDQINSTFDGSAFGDIDSDIINSIVEERAGPARQQVANAEARGTFNEVGSASANEFINNQFGIASDRITQIGEGINSGNQREVDAIRDFAKNNISGFELGDEGFDAAPFAAQRQSIIDDRSGSFGSDIISDLGSEALFDIGGAIGAGGSAQGNVSGTGSGGNNNLLDVIASREAQSNRTSRGLGSKGSGAF